MINWGFSFSFCFMTHDIQFAVEIEFKLDHEFMSIVYMPKIDHYSIPTFTVIFPQRYSI